MDTTSRFRIVFQKLQEAVEPGGQSITRTDSEISNRELDEIRELTRLALEIREPPARSYTMT